MNLRQVLEQRIRRALEQAGAPQGSPAMVMASSRPELGDYQANGVMAAAKQLKTNPRELAAKVLDRLDLSDLAETPEIAGPGFINIRLRGDYLATLANAALSEEKLGVTPEERPRTVVVDYSGPNLAKEMHVGHLRSTIIGDALVRVLDFLGDKVIRQNHVGDWGTQYGMLLAYMDAAQATHTALADLEEFYKAAKVKFDADPAFADLSRQYLVRLQGGDPRMLAAWEQFKHISLSHCEDVYRRLGVLLTEDDVHGESFYNDRLAGVIADLDVKGLLKESEGAQCVFLDEFKGKDDEPLPVLVRKSDGGYLYATTDLAAMRYRNDVLHADRVLYVTDSRQALHFQQVFAVARAAGFVRENCSLEHVPFGTMMGSDGRPFKTREGGVVKLVDLLDQAEQRAKDLVCQKNPELANDAARLDEVARTVGIGAVKYADLAHNRASDYVFAWDKMLSLEGNTAPYMQYAYARVRSIFRKGEVDADHAAEITITEPAERLLALKLASFDEAVHAVATDCLPHVLCGYLYDLAGAFMGFYESCPVLKADPAVRASRLSLCDLTARVIHTGLGLLGIATLEEM